MPHARSSEKRGYGVAKLNLNQFIDAAVERRLELINGLRYATNSAALNPVNPELKFARRVR
jgi:hypothetical protein